jgi:hypothetical protein
MRIYVIYVAHLHISSAALCVWAREQSNKCNDMLINTDKPEEPADELKDNEHHLLCVHCDGLGCYYCRNTGIMQWPGYDTLSEEADRDEIK